jgi:hypothetical protein
MISPVYSAPALAKVMIADPITTLQIREYISPTKLVEMLGITDEELMVILERNVTDQTSV